MTVFICRLISGLCDLALAFGLAYFGLKAYREGVDWQAAFLLVLAVGTTVGGELDAHDWKKDRR